METKPALKIRMLGGCSLNYGEKTIGDPNYHLKKTWILLAYLIVFRNRTVRVEELINLLYPGEYGKRPQGALKNQVSRVRAMLSELELPGGRELILAGRGTYAWNTDVPIQTDIDLFELACQRAGGTSWLLPEERLETCLSAIALYRNDFLSKAMGEPWVRPLADYYHTMYIHLVQTTVGLLSAQEKWEDVINICGRAIQIDAYEESFYYHLIRGLIHTGQVQQALERYKRMYTLFYTQLGVTPSAEMTELYQEIRREAKRNVFHESEDLAAISRFLLREERVTGAFFCELEVFTDIYNLEARSIARSGLSVNLGMIAAVMRDGSTPPRRLLNDYMERLGDCVKSTLRRGDVVTQYSAHQYLLLLPAPTPEKGQLALDRILSNFTERYPRCPLLMKTSIRQVEAILG